LRYPCPTGTDPERYEARLKLLARDCAGFAPGLLRKACDRVATQSRFLPTAAELHDAARALVEERQRQRTDEATAANGGVSTALDEALRQRNLQLIAEGFRHGDGEFHRWANHDGRPELVRCTGWGARARCNGDGTVSRAFWNGKDWVYA
jgi:hypothetical protein